MLSRHLNAHDLAPKLNNSCVGYAHQLSLKFAEQTSKDYFYLLHDKDEFNTLGGRNGCTRCITSRQFSLPSFSLPSLPTVTSLEFAGKKGTGLPEGKICVSEKILRMCYFKEEMRARNFPDYHGINYLRTISLARELEGQCNDCHFLRDFRRDFDAFIKVNEVKPETFKVYREKEGDEPFKWIIPKDKFNAQCEN
ncbi:MAG: hypothetical protein MJE68_18790 [Proteobacteria bacterium]|nr:hypothetical protein [Pseudomonadota bacterium]